MRGELSPHSLTAHSLTANSQSLSAHCQLTVAAIVVRRSSFVVRRSSFVVRSSSFVRCSSFVVRLSSFVVRRSSFVVRLPHRRIAESGNWRSGEEGYTPHRHTTPRLLQFYRTVRETQVLQLLFSTANSSAAVKAVQCTTMSSAFIQERVMPSVPHTRGKCMSAWLGRTYCEHEHMQWSLRVCSGLASLKCEVHRSLCGGSTAESGKKRTRQLRHRTDACQLHSKNCTACLPAPFRVLQPARRP